ncbi:hypothetical protein [uncultured Secundilactobacillus sp.]|uniref:hypothetical protein n=1 Tax=uncultured Secundilactobacillus sp. TaxID=2813935 RepID=UPI002588B77B|nr:hypothetical protein [uncultured Secundilactobacillus sp.]
MVYRSTGRRRILILAILTVTVLVSLSLIFTKQSHHSVQQFQSSKAISQHQVQLKFYTGKQHFLGSCPWSSAHAKTPGQDVTDLLNDDLMTEGSDVLAQFPHNYKLDRTNLENVKALRSVKLGETVKLIMVKVSTSEQHNAYQDFIDWWH